MGLAAEGRGPGCATLFGDGATSEGAFHEAATFAGVMKAPVVLLCNNNQWAISTPISKQTAAENLVDKAIGYGIPGVRVDGGDVLAVYEATRDAVERARRVTGRRSSKRSPIARRRMQPRTIRPSTSIPSGSRRSARTSASVDTSAICGALGVLTEARGRR